MSNWDNLALVVLTIEVIGVGLGIGISVFLWKTIFSYFPVFIKIILTFLVIILTFYGFIYLIIYINSLNKNPSQLKKSDFILLK